MLAFMVNSAANLIKSASNIISSCYGSPVHRARCAHCVADARMQRHHGRVGWVCLGPELNPVSSGCAAGSDLKLYTCLWDYTRVRLTPCVCGLRWAHGSTVPLLLWHPRWLQLLPPSVCHAANASAVQCRTAGVL